MEVIDCALPLVRGCHVHTDPFTAFKDLDYALLIGSRPRGQGMERQELLTINAKIFVEQGKALNNAKSSCKVVVVGNPCNTNCLIASKNCTTIPKENFSCLTMLDQCRTIGIISDKLNITNVDLVEGVFVLGNHSNTQVPIIDYATVKCNVDGQDVHQSLRTIINNDNWIRTDFVKQIQTRGGEVIKARGASSAASAAMAVVRHCNVLHLGSDKVTSLGVWSDGTH